MVSRTTHSFVLAMVKYRRVLTINGMIPRIVSKAMASKMAGSGLELQLSSYA